MGSLKYGLMKLDDAGQACGMFHTLLGVWAIDKQAWNWNPVGVFLMILCTTFCYNNLAHLNELISVV